MKFLIFYFQKAAIHIAIEKENIEIVKVLLSKDETDVNAIMIISNSQTNYIL